MTNNAPSLKNEISYLRRLAEEGRYGPVVGGVFLLAAGVIFGFACVVHWAILRYGSPGFASISTPYVWSAAWLVFGVFWVALYGWRVRGRAAARSDANAAFGMVWIACALGITVQCVAIAVVSVRLHAPEAVTLIMPSVFSYYGAAWWGTGALTKRRWMYGVAAASFAVALILALMTYSVDQLLVMGLALFVTLALPGLKLTLNEPRP